MSRSIAWPVSSVLRFQANVENGRVDYQGMNVDLLRVGLLLNAVPNLEFSGLEIYAIGTRYQLFILGLIGEPCFQVVFFGLLPSVLGHQTRYIGPYSSVI